MTGHHPDRGATSPATVGAPDTAAPGSAPPLSLPALKLGSVAVDPPVVLAPMAGVTNVAFRRLCRTYGAGLYVSEMITARALVEGNAKTLAMAAFGDDEPVRSVQLCGVHPTVMGAAVTRLVDEIGVDHIDLNFGCPAGKVTRQGAGAALPLHRALFAAIVGAAVDSAGSVPVTVKLRIGVDDEHITYLESGAIAEDRGAAAVTLHARTAEQLYSGGARWAAIAELKSVVSTIPVLGNGDLWEASDALAMVAATGCDGVVVGRGCLGRPWLFRDLADGVRRPRRAAPSGPGRDRDHDAHARRAPRRDLRRGARGPPVPQARRLVSDRLSRRLDGAALAGPGRITGRTARSAGRTLTAHWPFPTDALRMARGHTNGPRPVRLPAGWLDDVDDPTPPVGGDLLVSGG